MKRRKLVLAAMIAAMAVPSLSALAYDGDILTITADSDGDPFTWDTSSDKLAAISRTNSELTSSRARPTTTTTTSP